MLSRCMCVSVHACPGGCVSRNLNFNPHDSFKGTLAEECLQSTVYQHSERANLRDGCSASATFFAVLM